MNPNLRKLVMVVNVIVFVVMAGRLVYAIAPDVKRWVYGFPLGTSCEVADECRSGLCVGMRVQSVLDIFGNGPVTHGFCSDTCESTSDCEDSYVCDDDLAACVPAATSSLGEPCTGNWGCVEGECAFEMELVESESGIVTESLVDPHAPGECVTADEAFERRMKLRPDPLGLPF